MPKTHVPVLANEVTRLADGRRRIVDCTVGDGGHSVLMLQGGGKLVAIDRDSDAISVAKSRIVVDDVIWLNCSFADPVALEAIRRFGPDLVLFDLGVSSRHFDSDSRGFSFRRDVPLDMRMTASSGPTAADLLNTLDVETLTRMFRDYADERRSKHLANTIVRRRSTSPLVMSDDLVNAIRSALGPRTGPADFARLFQAVRIEVNGEIRALEDTLPVVLEALVPDGIVVVISYHSVEDRVVKHLFRDWARSCVCPTGVPICTCRGQALGVQTPRKPICPAPEEVASNSRARSAKMRVFRKADAS
jgi:16S rRNA (cytosine1402-N4)-methyltransferase